MSDQKMNIYGKLAAARTAFHELKLEKSGENKFAKYKYFELGDFLTPGQKCMTENGLCPVVTFTPEEAQMTIHETDGDGEIVITSPRAEANLKGCHPIQNLGAEQTYQRRYLWMAALEVVEHDAVDASEPAAEGDAPKAKKSNGSGVSVDQLRDLAQTGKSMNVTPDAMTEYVKEKFGAASVRDVTPDQFDELRAWVIFNGNQQEESNA